MAAKLTPLPTDLVPVHPGIEIVRLAALIAEGGALDVDSLDVMFEQVERGVLASVAPTGLWPDLERGLMSNSPQTLVQALRECGALDVVLPEVSALFGVPQISDNPSEVDIGEHILKALMRAAACNAPLEVRYALLVMNVGKSDSPREHLPVHYRHIERGAPRIEAISERFGVPDSCRELALLALAECERVHRVSRVRAGPVAAMLERIGAFRDPERFNRLMSVCTCDYLAYGGKRKKTYPQAQLLMAARDVCVALGDGALVGAGADEDLQAARAMAIAQEFGSQRWSNEQP